MPAGIRKLTHSMHFRFFWKNLVIYGLLTIMPVLLLLAAALGITRGEAERSARNSCGNLLLQTDLRITGLFEEIDSIYLYFSVNAEVTAYLPRTLKKESLDREELKKTATYASYLQNYTNTSNLLRSVYVYYDNPYGRFLSSEAGQISRLEGYYDTGWFASYKAEKEEERGAASTRDTWYELRSVRRNDFSKPFDVITVYRKIHSSLSRKTVGVIAVQLDCARLLNDLNALKLSRSHILAVADNNDQILLQTRDAGDLSGVLAGSRETLSQDGDFRTVELQGKKYLLMAHETSRNEDWLYFSLQPVSEVYAASGRLTGLLLLVAALAFAVSILLAGIKAAQDYRKLENILDILNNPEKAVSESIPASAVNTDPYSYISGNLLRMYLRENLLQQQISEKKYQMQILEMQALQQQINPHFLFNTLHSIYWEAVRLSGGPNSCAKAVSNLSDLMEYSLGDPKVPVKLSEEIKVLQAYLEIQQARYGDKYRVLWDIEEEAIIFPIPKMILQPLVENAIHHGIRNKPEQGIIKIKARLHGDMVSIAVIDTGVGIAPEKLDGLKKQLSSEEPLSAGSIGLQNTHRRLVLAYGEACGIRILSREGRGTVVGFHIPATRK